MITKYKNKAIRSGKSRMSTLSQTCHMLFCCFPHSAQSLWVLMLSTKWPASSNSTYREIRRSSGATLPRGVLRFAVTECLPRYTPHTSRRNARESKGHSSAAGVRRYRIQAFCIATSRVKAKSGHHHFLDLMFILYLSRFWSILSTPPMLL